MEQILVTLLRALKIPFSRQYIHRLVQSHPDYPSLLSASDTLCRLGINHAIHRIETEGLANLPFPYVLLIDNIPVLITNAADLTRHTTELTRWTGVVLQAEAKIRSRDKTNNLLTAMESRRRYCLTGIAILLVAGIAVSSFTAFSELVIILLFSSTIGATTGYFLIAKELGVVHETVEAFCHHGKNNHCDTVLKTDLKVLGISLSDAVIIYFSFQFTMLVLACVLPTQRHAYVQMLAWVGALTIPVMIFSLYYQHVVVKAWCRLCLVVIAVLAGQAIVFAMATSAGYILVFHAIPAGLLLASLLLFLIITLLVVTIKTSFVHAGQLATVGGQGNRIKHAPQVFAYLLSQQTAIDNTAFDYEMTLGDAMAPVKIIMVTNLYCTPCRAKHEVITELLEQYPGQVCVVLRFVPGGPDDEARMDTVPYLLHYWLTQLHGNPDETQQTEKMVSDWFRLGNLQKFKAQYSVDAAKYKDARQLMLQHYEWAKTMAIVSTPMLFVNGHTIPKDYTIEEVVMMASGLTDWLEKTGELKLQNA